MLVLLVGLTSAASLAEWELTTDGVAINVNSDVNAGTFTSSGVTFNEFGDNGANAEDWSLINSVDSTKYFEVTISPDSDHTLTISNINFDYSASIVGPASFKLQYSKQASFGSPTSIIVKEDVSTTELSSTNSVNIEVNSGETLTFRWFGYDFDANTNEFRIRDLVILGTTTEPLTERICAYDGGVTANDANLRVDIKEISVLNGLGEDDEWVLFDEIEVEIRVDNRGNYDVDDISLEWGIAQADLNNDWVVEFDEIKEFNLKDGDKDTFTITFRVNEDDLDFNLEDLVGNNYYLVVRATGTIDDNDYTGSEERSCAADFNGVSIVEESDFLILDNFEIEGIALEDGEYPGALSCGSKLKLTADLWNIGDSEQEDIEVRIYNSYLGIDETLEIGDVNSFDSESISFEFTIPDGMEEKWYELEFIIQEDGDVFENDYVDKDAEFKILFKLENCAFAQALVSASLDSGGKAGKELVVRATITNTGSESTSYLINAAGYAEWASSATVEPSTIVLGAGQSADVLITLDVSRDASGERLFNIEVLSEGQLVVNQPLSVSIEKALVGNLLGDNLATALVIGIALILVVIIIVLAIRVARK